MNQNKSPQTVKNQELANKLCRELGSASYQQDLMEKQLAMLRNRMEAIRCELDTLDRVTRELNKPDDPEIKVSPPKK